MSKQGKAIATKKGKHCERCNDTGEYMADLIGGKALMPCKCHFDPESAFVMDSPSHDIGDWDYTIRGKG